MSKARQLAQKPTQPTGRKNLIINGAMNVSQRYGAAQQTGLSNGSSYVADRFNFTNNQVGTFSYEQEPDAPNGFENSIKLTCTTADASPSSGDYMQLTYKFEGQDLQSLEYGSSSAKPVTVSFYVKSSKTGTYVCRLFTPDHSFRANHVSYTINSANTWEKKELIFVGDTSAAITSDNTEGLRLTWWLAAGSDFNSGTSLSPANSWGAYVSTDSAVGQVNIADTANATWQITGVQLEVGSVATEFEHRSYGEELALCQRYYCQFPQDIGGDFTAFPMWCPSAGVASTRISYPVIMRANPTFTFEGTLSADNSPAADEWGVYSAGAWRTGSGQSLSATEITHDSARIDYVRSSAPFTSGYAAGLYIYNNGGSTNRLKVEAEL